VSGTAFPIATTLEDRVARLELRAELHDLAARYCTAVDDRDLDAVLTLFTEDGSFGHQTDGGVKGHEAIRAHYIERLSGLEYSYHYFHQQLITGWDGADQATGIVSAQAEMGFDGELLVAAMRYHDTYRRVDGAWRFADRRLHFFYFLPADELVAGHLTGPRKRWPGTPSMADLPQTLESYERFHSSDELDESDRTRQLAAKGA